MTAPAAQQSTGAGPVVTLADLGIEDVTGTYAGWLADPDVMQFTESRFAEHTLENIREYVRKVNASKTDRMWRILADGRHVGNIKLTGINLRHRRAALSLLLGDKSVWGKGVATRAIRLATDYGFATYDLHKIFAGIYAANSASVRAFEKAGYVIEAKLRGHRCLDGAMVDEVLMSCFNPSEK